MNASTTSILGAGGAQPGDGEVGEAGVEAKRFADRLARAVEPFGLGDPDLAAGLADEVLAFAVADEAVEPGAVTEVDMADHTELLEALEVAVDRGQLDLLAGDLLGRDEALGGEQRLEDLATRPREAPAVATDRGLDLLEAAEAKRLAARRDRHQYDIVRRFLAATRALVQAIGISARVRSGPDRGARQCAD